MTHRRTKKQHGGMRFTLKALQYLIKRGVEHNEDYNDLNVMKFLIEHASGVRIVWDASTYSFIFELTFPDVLIDPYGLDLADSASTHDAFTAAAAAAGSAPEPGTSMSTFCAKLSFVYNGVVKQLRKKFKNREKLTVPSHKANGEADTQRMLFEAFACRRTTAPFVPDVIAHAILSGDQFRAMFANILSSNVASKEIYDWINAWITSHGIMVDVILMEMMDFQRTAPGVARNQPFAMIHQLGSPASHQQAALRMMAEIAAVRGKGIMPHDFHEGNGMATADGLQLYLIDWGGLFNLNIAGDRHRLLLIFEDMCKQSRTADADASMDAIEDVTVAMANGFTGADLVKIKRIARFPSQEELCGFFQIGFHKKNTVPDYRSQNLANLKVAFQTHLMAFVDFTCEPPTPQNVHSALMMVAFVDFMTNLMNFDHPYCQCGNVLKVVYPVQDVSVKILIVDINVTPFNDFRLFLSTFQVGSVPSNTRLQEVVAMIEENVRLCPSACGGVPLPVSHLRASSWINEEIRRRREEAEREAKRLAAEAKRLAAEAKKVAAEAKKVADTEAKRLAAARRPGVAKPKLDTNPKDAVQIQSAVAQAQAQAQSQSQGASVQEVAVPMSWLKRVSSSLSSKVSSMRNSLPAWLRKRQGGSRKQRKQRKQRKSFTKRRHN